MVFGIWEHAGKWGGGYVVDLMTEDKYRSKGEEDEEGEQEEDE